MGRNAEMERALDAVGELLADGSGAVIQTRLGEMKQLSRFRAQVQQALLRQAKRVWWAVAPARGRLGNWLSDIGSRRGITWLEYNPLLFMYYHEKGMMDAPVVIRSFEERWPRANRYYDVGAGTGAYAAAARRRGHDVYASEYARFGRVVARALGVPCAALDLNRDPPADTGGRRFDLAWCFEVAEHVSPPMGDRLVEHVASSAPTVIFTAARPGQGGTGHINEQLKFYWIERFGRHGKVHRPDLSAELAEHWRAAGLQSNWLYDNVMIFEDGTA
jgi:SAM-dependent methyltransferase